MELPYKCTKCGESMVQCDERTQPLYSKGLTDFTYYKKGKIPDHTCVAGALLMTCTRPECPGKRDQSSFKNLLVLCACKGCIQKDGLFGHPFEVDKVPDRLQRINKRHFCTETCQQPMVFDIYEQMMGLYFDNRSGNGPPNATGIGMSESVLQLDDPVLQQPEEDQGEDSRLFQLLQELLDDPVPQPPSLEVPGSCSDLGSPISPTKLAEYQPAEYQPSPNPSCLLQLLESRFLTGIEPNNRSAKESPNLDLRVASGASGAATPRLAKLKGSEIFYFEPQTIGNKLASLRLHVKIQGYKKKRERPGENQLFCLRAVTDEDIGFYCDRIFGDARVMKHYGSGQVIDPEKVRARIKDSIENRFGKGQPNGLLTVEDGDGESAGDPIGFSIVGGGGAAGYAEIAAAFIPEMWNRGYGSACADWLNLYASEVQRIGKGRCFQERDPEVAFLQSFRCYQGQWLKVLESTASPANYPTCTILRGKGFFPAVLNRSEREIKLGYELTDDPKRDGDAIFLELQTKFNEDPSLRTGARFPVVTGDSDEIYGTVSWKENYQQIKYHFEKQVVTCPDCSEF